jgi:hypothetical protein
MDVIRIAGRMIRRLLPKPYQLRRDLLMNRRIPSRESTIELLRSRILGERPSTNGVEHVILVDGVTEYTATTTEEGEKNEMDFPKHNDNVGWMFDCLYCWLHHGDEHVFQNWFASDTVLQH